MLTVAPEDYTFLDCGGAWGGIIGYTAVLSITMGGN